MTALLAKPHYNCLWTEPTAYYEPQLPAPIKHKAITNEPKSLGRNVVSAQKHSRRPLVASKGQLWFIGCELRSQPNMATPGRKRHVPVLSRFFIVPLFCCSGHLRWPSTIILTCYYGALRTQRSLSVTQRVLWPLVTTNNCYPVSENKYTLLMPVIRCPTVCSDHRSVGKHDS